MDVDEHTQIALFYRDHLDVFGNLKIAIVTDSPRDVVIPTLVELMDQGYYSKPFSDIESAVDWVLS